MKGDTKRRKWGGLGCVARIWVNIVTERRNVNYMRRCMLLGSVTLTRCQGLNWISDPAPFIRDPLPLITNHVPHNWDPAPFCWNPPLCTVYIWVFFSMHDVFNVVLRGYFFICICPRLVWIDAASAKHYLHAIKATQSALDARKSLVGGREPRACRDPPPLAE